MKPPEIATVPPSQIAEVAAFLRAKKMLDALKLQHPKAFAALAELEGVYNATLRAADDAVRTRLVSSGPFDLYQFARTDNGQALYDAVGRQRFASLGGQLEPIEKLTVNRALFDAAIAQQKIASEVVEAVVSWGPRYKKPGVIQIP